MRRHAATGDASQKQHLQALKGKAAIANAKLAYQLYRSYFVEGPNAERFKALEAQGAQVQRPLWASTGTKNPAYRDVMYVEELIGPNTVNTMPPATIAAFQEHGMAGLNGGARSCRCTAGHAGPGRRGHFDHPGDGHPGTGGRRNLQDSI